MRLCLQNPSQPGNFPTLGNTANNNIRNNKMAVLTARPNTRINK